MRREIEGMVTELQAIINDFHVMSSELRLEIVRLKQMREEIETLRRLSEERASNPR